ncbi:hypothetical protein Mapa_013228 [Marchantia paleacea]|nr:hypothetical protein Mapa_013228 [Marchantia paleacea]
MHPPAPSSLPHTISESCLLGGYQISPDSVIYFNIEASHHDPELWADPWNFKLERFLNREVDMMGRRDAGFIPFGAGRRVCPGLSLGFMIMSLTVDRLVQDFQWDTVQSTFRPQDKPSALDNDQTSDRSEMSKFKQPEEVLKVHPSSYHLRLDAKVPVIARLR